MDYAHAFTSKSDIASFLAHILLCLALGVYSKI